MNWLRKLRRLLSIRTVTMTLALVLSIGTATGGTLAWLMDSTQTLVNTFTYGDVNILLWESKIDPETGEPELDDDGNPVHEFFAQDYKMLPGGSIHKDPTVTVKQGTEDCWLFIQIDESENFSTFMEYAVAEGWTALPDVPNVYYRTVDAAEVTTSDLDINVLQDNTIRMKDSVTKEMLGELNNGEQPNYPTLSFVAYAVQRDASIEAVNTAEAAWTVATTQAAAVSVPMDDSAALAPFGA